METISLFPEEIIPMITPESSLVPEKKRGAYHDRTGKFTNQRTAEMAALEKEKEIFKCNYYYYKRVSKRLCEEIKAAQAKVKELEDKIRQYEKENVQPKEVSVA